MNCPAYLIILLSAASLALSQNQTPSRRLLRIGFVKPACGCCRGGFTLGRFAFSFRISVKGGSSRSCEVSRQVPS
ncbi:uncharacterized protein GGS22DRAFT_9505 [Annulohypoxylon maeteangense]|uniref:uncharacterized protein n=1 Tax=Annulohypoxylon maeteangense TaxID=1927788 RepID=UPI0020072D2A|nr:uncharacterized protein GGS22DRAFT_9505 [Annulohypoxylon maeteangense]KAI0890200.1 hypothetical protein GGS22DRAFT_9505 [Annulohypoxylon maeteangense]